MLPLLNSGSRFPAPDWDAIYAECEAKQLTSAPDLDAFWTQRGREWVVQLRDALGEGYRGYESGNFWLICREPEKTCRRLIQWAEDTHQKIEIFLGEAAAVGELFGKVPMLVLHDVDTYYEYLSLYTDDDETGMSSGVFLNRGYGHFLFSYHDLTHAEAVLAHELAHALVSHLPLPLWVNEGVAQLAEQSVTHRDTTRYDEIKESIDSYWTAESMQDFWSGRGFHRADEGQMHSYHLALVLTRKLLRDLSRFRAFLREVDHADFGAAALSKHFGLSLEQLVAEYFGPGDWTPRIKPQPDGARTESNCADRTRFRW